MPITVVELYEYYKFITVYPYKERANNRYRLCFLPYHAVLDKRMTRFFGPQMTRLELYFYLFSDVVRHS